MGEVLTPLKEFRATELMVVPFCNDESPCFVLLDSERCDWYVPYVVLEGKLRGHVYQTSKTTPVKKLYGNGYRIPSIPLLLFQYGELQDRGAKEALEYTIEDHKIGKEKQALSEQLPLFETTLFGETVPFRGAKEALKHTTEESMLQGKDERYIQSLRKYQLPLPWY